MLRDGYRRMDVQRKCWNTLTINIDQSWWHDSKPSSSCVIPHMIHMIQVSCRRPPMSWGIHCDCYEILFNSFRPNQRPRGKYNEGASFEWCESVGYWISTRSYTTRRRTLLFVLQHRWATLPQRFPTLSPLQKNLSQVLPCSESLGRTHIVLHVTLRFSM